MNKVSAVTAVTTAGDILSATVVFNVRAPSLTLTTTLLLAGLNAWTASSMPGLRSLQF